MTRTRQVQSGRNAGSGTGGRRLPDFVRPMLAQAAEPFDSARHLFEIKWDGARCLAFIEPQRMRLVSRRGLIVQQQEAGQVINFMEALKQSVAAAGKAEAKAKRPARKTTARRRKAKSA